MPTQHSRSDWHIFVIENERDSRILELILGDGPIYQTLALRFGTVVTDAVGLREQDAANATAEGLLQVSVIPASSLPLCEFRTVVKKFQVPGLVIPPDLEFETNRDRLIWETALCEEVVFENMEEIVNRVLKADE